MKMRTLFAVSLSVALPSLVLAGCSGGGDGGQTLGDLAPSTGDLGVSPTGCTPGVLEETGELVGPWGRKTVTIDGQEYLMQVNEWGASEPQTMAYGGDYFFKITQQQASSPTSQGPTGFPSMFIGANSGNSTSGRETDGYATRPIGCAMSGSCSQTIRKPPDGNEECGSPAGLVLNHTS